MISIQIDRAMQQTDMNIPSSPPRTETTRTPLNTMHRGMPLLEDTARDAGPVALNSSLNYENQIQPPPRRPKARFVPHRGYPQRWSA